MGAEMAVTAQPDERPTPALLTTKDQAPVKREQLLTTADAIGTQLEMLALREANEVAWIGLTLVGERSWMLLPLGIDLYSGIPGVALFLAYLGEMTGEARYTELARDSLTTVQNQIEGVKGTLKEIGGFGGWGSIIYTFSHLATLWQDPALLTEAEALVDILPQIIAEGIGWPTDLAREKLLAGFSHGAAGIAWTLLELFAASGKERFRQTALDGIAYERTLFLPQAGNWPDLRKLDLPEQTDNNENDQIGHIVARIGGFDCVIDPLCDIHLGKAVDVMNYGARYVTCGFYDQYSSLIGKDTQYRKELA
jgi:lantibiotic modifying enzyme